VTILAAGGILYLVFQKIEPQAKPAMHFAPPLGAVFGSALGGTRAGRAHLHCGQ
jgi:ZIP family zinc transporter